MGWSWVGLLVANPIPVRDEIPADIMNDDISTAQAAMTAQELSEKQVTPSLLLCVLNSPIVKA
ncbi:pseudouridine-5'-phosphate glycosidase [uncultured Sulfitobacter sp.]|uniref:pseudouridine-5'-phosphate glycosidase n=1 Tax=uncultured Sulfitobacter sp. TaxID=191468 RepID=UPI002637950D|nr:pseudouridine-5'-phosphate glycosidase [uncultured Sulfitobacter sp.]